MQQLARAGSPANAAIYKAMFVMRMSSLWPSRLPGLDAICFGQLRSITFTDVAIIQDGEPLGKSG
jgi:hypothetical protein